MEDFTKKILNEIHYTSHLNLTNKADCKVLKMNSVIAPKQVRNMIRPVNI